MKITKYAQSCGLIETKQGKRLLVDPGSLEYDEKLLQNDWVKIDAIFVTHKHSDHCNSEAINKIIERDTAKLYTTAEVYAAFPDLIKGEIVKEGDVVDLGGIKVEVVKAVHGWQGLFRGTDKFPHENIGYIIDDGDKRAYFTSDTIAFENDHKCNAIFLPVNGHGVVMGPWEAALFAKDTGARYVFPVHDNNPIHPVNWEQVEKDFKNHGMEYKKLKIGESVII